MKAWRFRPNGDLVDVRKFPDTVVFADLIELIAFFINDIELFKQASKIQDQYHYFCYWYGEVFPVHAAECRDMYSLKTAKQDRVNKGHYWYLESN